MSDLIDFLLARIAEDESRLCDGPLSGWGFPDAAIARPMAECAAKRRIVEAAIDNTEPQTMALSGLTLEWVMAELAIPYADHSDYREVWNP